MSERRRNKFTKTHAAVQAPVTSSSEYIPAPPILCMYEEHLTSGRKERLDYVKI